MATPEVAVIGAGPVGLFTVFQCGTLGMRCHVIDALGHVGGQCAALYPEKPIYDVAGLPTIKGAELVANLEAQALPFAPIYHLGERVEKLVQGQDGQWLLTTSVGAEIAVRAVVVAAGAGAFVPNRPPLQGIEAFEGRSVFYSVGRVEDFAGRRVVIAGGGDSAVDWTLSLAETGAKVFLVHRRDRFRAAPDSVERLRRLEADGIVETLVPYQLAALHGDGGQLAAVDIVSLDGRQRRLEADILLPMFGLSSDLGAIAGWGLDMVGGRIPVDPMTCATARAGIVAVGDVACYPGKLKLMLTGFAEAAHAAHALRAFLRPGEPLHFQHSTSRGLPAAAA
ncbi:MAG TPA: NAD(P)/FAD-dependent oxidoreductase [Magnetospirillum sp.]|nr:NAD(P)/FAD-dependent oxidoreductase [Magnetospirillum sp.]